MSATLTPPVPTLPSGPPPIPETIGDDVTTVVPSHHEAEVTPEYFRFTVEEYYRLGDIGILSPESRVELIDGLIVCKPMQKPPHARILRFLNVAATKLDGPEWTAQSQLPLNLTRSSPEPDISILRGPAARYDERHASPDDVALVIEISDTTLAYDSTTKAGIYARDMLPQYWIVNIPDARVEVYSRPTDGAYADRADFVAGQSLPIILDGITVGTINVGDLLG